jgi:hypothetical protein
MQLAWAESLACFAGSLDQIKTENPWQTALQQIQHVNV